MKKNRLKISKTSRNILFIILGFILISLCSVGYAYFSTELNVKGKAAIYVPPVQQDFRVDINYQVYSTNPYNLDATVTITNVGEHDATAWEIYVTMPIDAEIVNYYGAELISNEGNIYYFDNPNGNNDYIAVGESISFHIQYKTPSDYEITHTVVYGTNNTGGTTGGEVGGGTGDEPEPTDPCEGAFISDNVPESETNNGLTASYTIGNSWPANGGITKELRLTVTNNGSTNSIWIAMIDIKEGGTVAGCYEGTCSVEGTNVTIIPPSYASTLEPGQSITKNYHINVMNNNEINLFYVGKSTNGYLPACQPVMGVSGGNPTSGETLVSGGETPVSGGKTPVSGGEAPEEPITYGDDDNFSETNGDVSANYVYQSNWNGGKSGFNVYATQLTIENNSDTSKNGWTAKFKVPETMEITGCWTGTCSLTGDTLTLTGTNNINKNNSVKVSYQFTLPVGTEMNLYSIE